MATVLESKDAKDWFYKGEGAANLVLGYCGTSPFLVNKVLRISKSSRVGTRMVDNPRVLSFHEQILWKDIKELVEATSKHVAQQIYMVQVMSPLLGPEHVDGGTCITVSREFLDMIKENVNCQRPAWRVNAADIDMLCTTALLLYDHSTFPNPKGSLKDDVCLALELKPKCGFLPTSDYIERNNNIKKQVTRFRMHQLLKLHLGEISQVSEYDPLDLFSGSRERINQAVISLFATPQNNLRIFMNGCLIFGGLGSGMSNADHKADPTFKSSGPTNDDLEVLIQKCGGLSLTRFLKLVAETIFFSRILNRLIEVQKRDVLDIEGAIHLYYDIISQPCKVCRSLSGIDLLHQYSFLHTLPLERSLQIVKDFLIAATAKDCSLFLSFRHRESGDMACSSVFLESENQNFEYKANFIDLDRKPFKKMVYYYDLDQKIVNFYKQITGIEGNMLNSDSASESTEKLENAKIDSCSCHDVTE